VRLIVEREALREAMAQGGDEWEAAVVAAGHALGLAEQRLGTLPVALDDAWSQRHREFHLALYAGARSPTLQGMVAELFDGAERYRRFSARHRKTPRAKRSEHQALQAAALARDETRALGLLAGHIAATERHVAAALLAMGWTGPQ
jgi:DNA-binding GntR family transcriptional regulator